MTEEQSQAMDADAAAASVSSTIHHVISLGSACFTAQAIQDAGLRRFSLPFDWIFSGAGLIRQCLLDDFSAFLARERYVNLGSPKSWTLPLYQRLFGSGAVINHHDLSHDPDYQSLTRAVGRLKAILASPDCKLFTMMMSESHIEHPHVKELIDTIAALTDNARFLLIGFRPAGDTATLETVSDDERCRTVVFTPRSELVEGLRFGDPADNALLRSAFDHYRFDLMHSPSRSRPDMPVSRLIMGRPIAPELVMDIGSAGDLLDRVDVETISPPTHAPRPEPDFLYGDYSPDRLRHFLGDEYIAPVRISRIRDALLYGPFFATGALIRTGELYLNIPDIASNPANEPSVERLTQIADRLDRGAMQVRRIEGEVLLLAGNGHQIYGHWLVDFLPKLAMLPMVGIDPGSVRVLLPTNMAGFGHELLRLVGIREEHILTHDPEREVLRVDSLLVPSTLRWGGRCVPQFREAIDLLNERTQLPTTSTTYPERIFLSRSLGAQHGRRLIGEAELIREAESFGFCALAPETLPLPEQVALLRAATHIIGPYGSGLHGSIFNRRQVKVCGFHGPSAFDGLQSGIGERLGQPTGYVFGIPTPSDDDRNANTVDPLILRQYLTEQVG